MPDFSDPVQIGRNLACLAGTVEDGAINVIIDGTTPTVFGTTTQTVLVVSNETVTVPAGWSSWAATTLITNTSPAVIAGADVPPGISIGHGIEDGYPGVAFDVTVPFESIVILSYTVSVPTP